MTIVNNGPRMMPEYHPMHVHGHFFRLMNTAGGTTHPPLKDTVLIAPNAQPGSTALVQILMDNPGRWLLHCHNMDHMATGMMTAIEYGGDDDGDGIATRSDYEPMSANPVTTIAAQAVAFRPGAVDQILVQWTAGQAVALFAGFTELATPLAFPPYGVLVLDPTTASLFGTVTPTAGILAGFGYAIPNDPNLIGLRIAFQSVGLTMLQGGFRLGTFQAMTIR